MNEPHWARVEHPPIDYQDLHYYAAPKKKAGPKSLDEVDPELLRTYEKLGIPLKERAILAGVDPASVEGRARQIAVDAVFDSVSVATTFRATLAEGGRDLLPDLRGGARLSGSGAAVSRHASCRSSDNFFAALNSAVFTDGSFVYIPKGVRCPMELSTYFRINARSTGQFERTLIIAEAGALRELSGRLHRADARREPVARRGGRAGGAWTTRRSNTRRCRTGIRATRKAAAASTISSPSAAPAGARAARSPGRRWRPARRSPGNIRPACCRATTASASSTRSRVTNNCQQADTGTKMIHIGKRHQEHDHLQGDQRRAVEQHLSRPGARAAAGVRRAQLHAVRLAADRRRLRRAHRAVYRKPQSDGEGGARGDHLEDRRRPVVLLPPARAVGRGRGQPDRQRVLQGSAEGAADGIRRRGAEAAGGESGRLRGLRDAALCWKFAAFPPPSRTSRSCKGIDLTVPQGEMHAIMGPNGSGKSTLAYVLSGREDYAVTGGSVDVRRPRPAGDGAGGARRRRLVPGVPVSDRTARRRQRQFPAHRAERACAARAARANWTRCSS